MTSFLKNIKSIFILRLISNNVPYIKFLKIIKHSKLLLKKLEFNEEYYKKASAIIRVLDPSYSIEKYYKYFKISTVKEEEILDNKKSKKKIDVNEWTLFKCLNSCDFNVKLNIPDNNFKYIINNAYKINLIIDPETIKYLEDISKESQENIFNLLQKNKIHIVEFTICGFNSENSLQNQNIKCILYLLCRIFQGKDVNYDSNNNIIINNKDNQNNNNYIKKFNFLKNSSKENTELFFDKINNIISLKNISLNIDYISDENIGELNGYIYRNFSFIKSLSLNMEEEPKKKEDISYLAKIMSLTNIFNQFFYFQAPKIEILDLSNYELHAIILRMLNSNFRMLFLKELKLNIIHAENEKINLDDWNFILKIVNTLEVLELCIKNTTIQTQLNYNFLIRYIYKPLNYNLSFLGNGDNLIMVLNKVKNLKKVKLNLILNGEALINFKNYEKIEYLDITLATFPDYLNTYFNNFKNLKSLAINFENKKKLIGDKIKLTFPSTINHLELRNLELGVINSILRLNQKKLQLIEKFLVKFKKGNLQDFRQLICYYLIYFKTLKKLSILTEGEEDVTPIFKTVPSLSELNLKMNVRNYPEILENLLKYKTPNIINLNFQTYNDNNFKKK